MNIKVGQLYIHRSSGKIFQIASHNGMFYGGITYNIRYLNHAIYPVTYNIVEYESDILIHSIRANKFFRKLYGIEE